MEIAPRAFEGGRGLGRLLRRVVHAQLKKRLVELFGGDLAFRHRLAEIPSERAVLAHCLLELPGRARDRVRDLVPVLGRQLARTGSLGDRQAEQSVSLLVAASNRVQVAGSLSDLIEILDGIRGELGRHRLNVVQIVHCLVSVLTRRLRQLLDLPAVKPSEIKCSLELLRRVRRRSSLFGDVLNPDRRRSQRAKPDKLRRQPRGHAPPGGLAYPPSLSLDAAECLGDVLLNVFDRGGDLQPSRTEIETHGLPPREKGGEPRRAVSPPSHSFNCAPQGGA